jgi:hypothetical protein
MALFYSMKNTNLIARIFSPNDLRECAHAAIPCRAVNKEIDTPIFLI